MKELKDTIALMQSEKYEDRLRAEYWQLCIRINKLNEMLDKWDKGTLKFKPVSDKHLFVVQRDAMVDLLDILVSRASAENIDLNC